jgi:hypothetical protein
MLMMVGADSSQVIPTVVVARNDMVNLCSSISTTNTISDYFTLIVRFSQYYSS